MSHAAIQPTRHTAASYLAFERAAETKHEFISGEIVAMAGATREHNLLTGNTARRLGNQLESKTCETYANDMRVRTTMKNYVYPDVVIVCGKPRFEDKVFDTLLNPVVVVVEVLSQSSEARDRGEKFFNYRAIESVQDILFISQREMRVEHYVRQADNEWRFYDLSLAEVVRLDSIGCALTLAEIYERVEFQPEGTEDEVQSEEAEPN